MPAFHSKSPESLYQREVVSAGKEYKFVAVQVSKVSAPKGASAPRSRCAFIGAAKFEGQGMEFTYFFVAVNS